MGLFDRLFKKDASNALPRPDAVVVKSDADSVYAATNGSIIAMSDIPDPVFASGAMGPAVGIKPTEGIVYAPVSGEVTVTTATLHAMGLMSDDGVEILIHMGVDTVNMKGDGFHSFVSKGDFVRAGEPLLTVDLEKIAAAGYEDVLITVVTNADDFSLVETVAEGSIAAGERLMSIVR